VSYLLEIQFGSDFEKEVWTKNIEAYLKTLHTQINSSHDENKFEYSVVKPL